MLVEVVPTVADAVLVALADAKLYVKLTVLIKEFVTVVEDRLGLSVVVVKVVVLVDVVLNVVVLVMVVVDVVEVP